MNEGSPVLGKPRKRLWGSAGSSQNGHRDNLRFSSYRNPHLTPSIKDQSRHNKVIDTGRADLSRFFGRRGWLSKARCFFLGGGDPLYYGR